MIKFPCGRGLNMIDYTSATLNKLIVHKVGNKLKQEGYFASKSPPNLSEREGINANETLMNYFLSSFTYDRAFRFDHTTDLDLNEVYAYCKVIFEDLQKFNEQSINILKHLYNKSNHPNVKGGELYIGYLTSCFITGKEVDAIGIFKSENKDTFLQVNTESDNVTLNFDKGINAKKLDKGAIILNIDKENGYKIYTIDTSSKKADEAKYWTENFLSVTDYVDNRYHTQKYLNICKNYSDSYVKENTVPQKLKKVEFLSKTLEYFEENSEFDLNTFTSNVFKGDKQEVKTFEDFIEKETLPREFLIESTPIKKERKKLNEIIKLDNRIEIKIKINPNEHQENNLIEKGFDEEKRMSYYKVYFNQEL